MQEETGAEFLGFVGGTFQGSTVIRVSFEDDE